METGCAVLERASRAAANGDLASLERILAESPEVIRARDTDGHTLLGLACKAATGNSALPPVPGSPEQHAAVQRILAAGADPCAAANDGWSPLHTAAMTGHVELARRLLAAGASREGRLLGARGGSPLALALFYAQTRVAELLAEPPVPDNLRTAAALDLPLQRFIAGDELTRQAAEGTDFYRPSTVFPAWERCHSRQELLDEALSWAARNEALDAMAALLQLGADVNANPYRGTPLLWAIYGGRVAALAWLLDHGADPDLRHDFGGAQHGRGAVAMHLAAQLNALRCLRLLLDRGADPTVQDAAYGATPLGWAEHAGAVEAAAMLRAHLSQ
jgi:ankyrin repeat protein